MAELDRNAYLEQRVDKQLRWLSQESSCNKKIFMGLTIFGIVLGTAITVGTPLIGVNANGRTLIAMA